ncbi:MAG: diguanylate cyclase [Armatimonadota bacterium]|nr:diguanylate cyclase [Armatimonadota bacterium]MDR7402091.1 diguanylate cyclase [Armatimonadota bacterium]MDR7437083.1 diguanylate cyclase [Armatimonadota bacterium]MDR7517147.1 diguanylate cyclase [Armatimonadota bacterium]MDR7582975.1 diguanylate cyclase [Armatimonadota bacterium]
MMIGRTGRLLVAEDDESLRNLLVRYFASLGHTVDACADGATAIARVATTAYDVIITDILMPGAGGLEVMRAAKAADRFVEVVILTGAPDLSTTVRALREGDAFDYILKPFPNVEILRATVDRALERRHLRQENERLARELRQFQATDPLTGTLNRRAFFDQGEPLLARAVRHQEPLSLIMVDLDGFRDVNERLGPTVADAVLARCAQICREQLRAEDLLARYWADKFVCLLPVTGLSDAALVAERIRSAIAAAPLSADGQAIPVRASAGVTSRQAADRSLDTLVRRAERALRRAKERGGNQVWTEG